MSRPIVVITGASGGVGSACVEEFRAAGYLTVGVDVVPGSKAEEHLEIDLSAASCGDEIAAAIGERQIEVLVNNAAVGDDASLAEVTPESWDTVMAVNLRAPFLVARALRPLLAAGGGGSVVNVSSVHALATSPGAGVYATSKGALISLTRAMALEWAPELRANCVVPGAVDAPMLRQGLERTGQRIDEIAARHPLGRVATSGEIARVVRFVAVEATFMTGSTVVVDGGVLSRLSSE